MDISWAFVPKAFSLLVSSTGEDFQTVFSTDTNIANYTSVVLDGRAISSAKVVMTEARLSVEYFCSDEKMRCP